MKRKILKSNSSQNMENTSSIHGEKPFDFEEFIEREQSAMKHRAKRYRSTKERLAKLPLGEKKIIESSQSTNISQSLTKSRQKLHQH